MEKCPAKLFFGWSGRNPATERRKAIAHGATVGKPVKKNFQPRQGRQKGAHGRFFRPVRGWIAGDVETHGFTVGYSLPRLRRWGMMHAMAKGADQSKTLDSPINFRSDVLYLQAQSTTSSFFLTRICPLQQPSEFWIICFVLVWRSRSKSPASGDSKITINLAVCFA